jgi:hypothetical protein
MWLQCPDGADRHEQTPSCDQMACSVEFDGSSRLLDGRAVRFDWRGGRTTLNRNGDVWVDRLSSGDREYRVLSVTANGVLYTMWGAQQRSDSQWNPIVTSSLTESKDPPLIYARPLSMFPLPLIPGKIWSDETRWQIPDLSWAGRSVLQGKVGEWEQVAVPAGTFQALRVDVTIRGIGRLGWNHTAFITYWYTPECNRFVKLHFGDEN